MKLIIAGSRGYGKARALELVTRAMEDIRRPSLVISGTARGIDQAGEEWAAAVGLPVERVPADWERYGRAAGPLRNALMAEMADALLLIWDGASRGSASMLKEAHKRHLRIWEVVAPLEGNTDAG